MTITTQPRLRVAIVGGGIGGLILAVALSESTDIEVDVYEAARQYAEVGAGVGLWPRPWKILKKLGLSEDLAKMTFVSPGETPRLSFEFRKADQAHGTTFQRLITSGGLSTFYRPDFQSVVLRHLSERHRLHTSKRLVSYTQSPPSSSSSSPEPIKLYFQDGTTATCDLLVAADGLKSAVRARMYRDIAARFEAQGQHDDAREALRCVSPTWSGMMSYRTTVNADVLREKYPGHRVLTTGQFYLGKDTQVTAYPVSRGARINVAAFRVRYDLEDTKLDVPWVQETTKDEILGDFDGWEEEVQALIDCIEKPSRWAVHTVRPLKTFVDGRVVLLGDGAHAMIPFQGSGAGQAIEDAYILATLLNRQDVQRTDLPRVAEVYDAIRRPFAQHVAAVSAEAGRLHTLNHPAVDFHTIETNDGATNEDGGANDETTLADDPRLQETFRLVRDNWKWAWESTIDGDVRRALDMLDASSEA